MDRTCKKCQTVKPIEEFSKHAACKGGYQHICKECKNAYLRAYMAAKPEQRQKKNERRWVWRADPENRAYENAKQYERFGKSPDKAAAASRKHLLKKLYGLTLDQYDELVAAQDGKCAICRGFPEVGKHKFFHVDHDHETGRVRALLCTRCNTALGLFLDDPAIITAAADYVIRHRDGL